MIKSKLLILVSHLLFPNLIVAFTTASHMEGTIKSWGTSLMASKAAEETSAASSHEEPPNFVVDDFEEDSTSGKCMKTADVLSLDTIRKSLIRQEETIIFALIERSQFMQNRNVYQQGGLSELIGGVDQKETRSLLEYMLQGTEKLHCSVRRYTSPEEHAFFPELLAEKPLLQDLDYPELLSPINDADKINYNSVLMSSYLSEIVPAISKSGDDEQYGSTVTADVAVLQALSKRAHFGKFVAESKYRSNPEEYQLLVDADDSEGVMKLLTNAVVEEKVLRRAKLKAATYGREPMLANMPPIEGTDETCEIIAAAAASAVVAAVEAVKKDGVKTKGKIDPAVIEGIYRDIVIPLTKDIEVAYLYRRCGRNPPEDLDPTWLTKSNKFSLNA